MRTSTTTKAVAAVVLSVVLATPATFAAPKQGRSDRDTSVIERVIRIVKKILNPTISEQPIIPIPNTTT